MSAISDKAINKLTSQNKFNGGVELEEDYGVNLYSTFYRQYDPQIGRFGGVDPKAEATIGLSPFGFANDNPISFNDPFGDLSSADWADFISRLESGSNLSGFGDYGGSYTSVGGGNGGGGFSAYGSDAAAFAAGAGYADFHNLWGTNGFASSLGAAQNAYYGHGGTDAGVRGVQPSVIVSATRQNGGSLSFGGVTWNWNGNKMSSEGWSTLGAERSGERFQWNWPEISANITAAAGGAFEIGGIGISAGKGITAFGLKGNDFFFIGHQVTSSGLGKEVQRTWGEGSIFTNGIGFENINTGGKQTSEVFNYRSSIFLYESSNNPNTGETSHQLSLDIGTTIGLGLIGEVEIKWPFWGD